MNPLKLSVEYNELINDINDDEAKHYVDMVEEIITQRCNVISQQEFERKQRKMPQLVVTTDRDEMIQEDEDPTEQTPYNIEIEQMNENEEVLKLIPIPQHIEDQITERAQQ